MAVTDFVVAESPKDSTLRVHRATCSKLASRVATNTPVPLDRFLAAEAVAFRGPGAPQPGIASCCKPKAAKVYLEEYIAPPRAEDEPPAEREQRMAAERETLATDPDDAPPADDQEAQRITDEIIGADEPLVEAATFTGPKYLWPAARKGALDWLGDRPRRVVAESYTVFVADADVARELGDLFGSAVADLKAARKDERFEGVAPYGEQWTRSPRYALEQEIVRGHVASGGVL